MEREEFRRTVRAMQDQGVPLTMANLLVRTELPRAQIEAWLDEMQRDVSFAPPRREAEAASTPARSSGSGLASRARALREEIVSDAMRSRLGLGTAQPRTRRSIRTGGVLGLALPPVGLFYAAPVPVGVVGTLAYLAVAFVALKLALLGGIYLLPLAHLAGGFFGAAYAWRFNRRGQRAALLPRPRRRDDD